MYEQERMRLHKSIEFAVREMLAGSTLEFHAREINGVTVTGRAFPYKIIGISGVLPAEGLQGGKISLVGLYLKIIGGWYRVNFDPHSPELMNATVDRVEKIPDKGLFLTESIGWVKQKPNGMFDFYSNLAEKEMVNYEHPDLAETVMKLAVVHDAAMKQKGIHLT